MPFQFLCPQGHLLQGDESQMGLQTQCPLCGVAFIIPHVAPQPAPQIQQPMPQQGGFSPPQEPQQQFAPQQYPPQPAPQYAQQQAPYSPPQQQAPAYQAPAQQAARQAPPAAKKKKPPQQQPAAPTIDLSSDLGSDLGSELGGGGLGALSEGGSDLDSAVLHIPCPNGHELETPVDMLGEECLCPHCGVQFKLLERDSIEYLHKQAIIDQQRAHFWFNWSIAAAVVVVIMLLAMLIVALRG
jgi:hypothetical protein